jgi:hypothetical protein
MTIVARMNCQWKWSFSVHLCYLLSIVYLFTCEADHPEEQEDDAIAEARNHLGHMVDGHVTVGADIPHGVPVGQGSDEAGASSPLDDEAVPHNADDAGPVEDLRHQEGHVAEGEDDERLGLGAVGSPGGQKAGQGATHQP